MAEKTGEVCRMKRRIGEVLIEAGLINRSQLEIALKLQKGRNKRLGKVLIELGYLDESRVAEALSKQLSLPLVVCSKFAVTQQLLDMIPKDMAESRLIFPLELNDGKVLLAMADPLDWQTISEVAFKNNIKVSVAISSESCILEAIEQNYGSQEKIWDLMKEMPQYGDVEFIKGEMKADEAVNEKALSKRSEAPPIVRLVTMLIADAVTVGASDIHIEPSDTFVLVRYRVDGELKNVIKYPKHIQASVISRVKIISNLDITNRRLPQDGRSTLRLKDKAVDLRISTLPTVYGEKIVIRLLDRTTGLIPLSKLGLPERILKPLIEVVSQPQGMVLVTGPTGSGKTTTLYAILQQLRTESENVITIEDPVEYKLSGITQVGVNEAIGLGFSSVLKSVLRQDPDIIMVGEIRDTDTASIAARASLTGHLVLSTVHTNSTVATLTRLLDIGLEPFLISSAVTAVLAQRLVRRVCPNCRVQDVRCDYLASSGFPPLESAFKGAGCSECRGTGFKGRVGVYEFLMMDTKLRRLLSKGASEDALWEAALEGGTVGMFYEAWDMVKKGEITVEEAISKIPFDQF